MKPEARWKPHREPLLMALVSGFIDTLGFVALFGLFTAHVTGNLVLAGAEMAGGRHDVATKLLAVPVFVAAVAVTAVLIRRSAEPERMLPGLMLAEVVGMGMSLVFGLKLPAPAGADSLTTMLIGFPMVVAMGIRNASARMILGFTAPTTIMTGNVVQLTIDATALRDPVARARAFKFLPTILGFVLGATLGAFGYAQLGYLALALPMAITLGIAIVEWAATSQR